MAATLTKEHGAFHKRLKSFLRREADAKLRWTECGWSRGVQLRPREFSGGIGALEAAGVSKSSPADGAVITIGRSRWLERGPPSFRAGGGRPNVFLEACKDELELRELRERSWRVVAKLAEREVAVGVEEIDYIRNLSVKFDKRSERPRADFAVFCCALTTWPKKDT
jgi:hypothetical protein